MVKMLITRVSFMRHKAWLRALGRVFIEFITRFYLKLY